MIEQADDSTMVTGNDLVVRELLRQGVDTAFFLMGGPMIPVEGACIEAGIRMIDVRHEQAAALAAQAYARVSGKIGVCMACSGPGVTNLTTGIANAFVDCVPILALGGSSPLAQYKTQAFQEVDQLAMMRPISKWAERVHEVHRIPEYIDLAITHAMSGKPGPAYLDLPGDILNQKVSLDKVVAPRLTRERVVRKAAASPEAIADIVSFIGKAERPVVLTGTGVLWADASKHLTDFVDRSGIPFYTTPQGRGAVPEDHEYAYLNARTTAIKEADLVLVIGTRLNYVFGFGAAPRMSADAKIVQIDTDPEELSRSGTISYGVVADAGDVLQQLSSALDGSVRERFGAWRAHLSAVDEAGRKKQEAMLNSDSMPIHPLRLCREIRDFIDRDAILVVDGQEILNFGRQSIPSFVPGHRLNSGPFGTMGVGVPFSIGAQAAKPDKQVIGLHGDGAFGLNAMEIDVAVRHKLPIMIIVSVNGGWTSDPKGVKPGSRLGYPRLDHMAEVFGCHGEYVERPEDIRPALERSKAAMAKGQPALINVVTDAAAHASTVKYSFYRT